MTGRRPAAPGAGPTQLSQAAPLSHRNVEVGAGYMGFGTALPNKVVTNLDLEKMVDTSDEWITTRTGIKERRVVEDGEASSDLGVRAAREALARSGVSAAEIDLLVVSTSSPDVVFPSTASIIQYKLGLNQITAFDVMAVCTGFIYATTVAASLIQTGGYRRALVIGTDAFSRFIDWEDRGTCILFGDGAGAAVMSPCDPGFGVLDSFLAADGSGFSQLYVPAGGSALPATPETVAQRQHFVKMSGSEVFKFAVRAIPEACEKLLEQSGYSMQDVAYVIPHQANQRIIEAARTRLGVPAEKMPGNLERYGNTSTASIPLVLDELWEEGRLHYGDLIIVVGFGAGLTWGANLIRWNGPDRPLGGRR